MKTLSLAPVLKSIGNGLYTIYDYGSRAFNYVRQKYNNKKSIALARVAPTKGKNMLRIANPKSKVAQKQLRRINRQPGNRPSFQTINKFNRRNLILPPIDTRVTTTQVQLLGKITLHSPTAGSTSLTWAPGGYSLANPNTYVSSSLNLMFSDSSTEVSVMNQAATAKLNTYKQRFDSYMLKSIALTFRPCASYRDFERAFTFINCSFDPNDMTLSAAMTVTPKTIQMGRTTEIKIVFPNEDKPYKLSDLSDRNAYRSMQVDTLDMFNDIIDWMSKLYVGFLTKRVHYVNDSARPTAHITTIATHDVVISLEFVMRGNSVLNALPSRIDAAYVQSNAQIDTNITEALPPITNEP